MKKIFFLLLLFPLAGMAQVYQVLPQYGYEMKRVNPTLVLQLPTDTVNNKLGIARVGSTLYVGNGTYWTGGSGNYLDSFWRVSGIDSNYYRINGVTYAVLDSTGGGGINIYNSDGTLVGNRTVDGDGNDLTFSGISNFKSDATATNTISTNNQNNFISVSTGVNGNHILINTDSLNINNLQSYEEEGDSMLVISAKTNLVKKAPKSSGGDISSTTLTQGTGILLDSSIANNYTVSADTSVLATQYDLTGKLDSVTISIDTVYGYENGVRYFQFKSPAFANWLTNGTKIYTTATQVGIGVDTANTSLTVVDNSITNTASETGGIRIANYTPATAGNQKWSPSLIFEGQGWKTATASSLPAQWRVYSESVQGTAVPGAILRFQYKEGGNPFTTLLTLNSNQLSKGAVIGGYLSASSISSATNTQSPVFTAVGNSGVTNIFSWNVSYAIPVSEERRAFYTQAVNTGSGILVGFQNVNGINRFNSTSGSTVIGGTTPDASAKLDVQSTTTGFLPPRMTGTQAEAISSPAEGLLIYSTDGSGSTITSKGWWGYDGTTWVKLN